VGDVLAHVATMKYGYQVSRHRQEQMLANRASSLGCSRDTPHPVTVGWTGAAIGKG
jgi:hypothetical protein